ncbi:MAG TPA: N-acetyltransferase [Bacteroidaceae bacterium]|nr:N-acetyltransferase [Bacteroidaceae bacterium]
MHYTTKEVKTAAEMSAFIQFNYTLYRGCEYSVPDLITDLENTFSPEKNAAYEFCDAAFFLTYDEVGQVVGRVAAIINHRANDKWNVQAVRFGWIDFVDEFPVSQQLLDTVSEWGKQKGMKQLQGPLGFTDFDNEGCLIDGFDQLGTMGSLYNYPYYSKHFEAYGMIKDADWVEFKIYIPEEGVPTKHQRIAEIVKNKYDLKILKYKSARKLAKEYGWPIFELLNESYANLYGFSPLTEKQIKQYIKTYLPVLDLRMVTLITESTGRLIGVGISMPSMSVALQKSKGKLLPLGWVHLLKALKGSHQGGVLDLLLVAIHPEYQGKGVNALLFSDLIPVYKDMGFKYAESNPELEINGKVQAQWEYFKTEQHKRRRAFKMELK